MQGAGAGDIKGREEGRKERKLSVFSLSLLGVGCPAVVHLHLAQASHKRWTHRFQLLSGDLALSSGTPPLLLLISGLSLLLCQLDNHLLNCFPSVNIWVVPVILVRSWLIWIKLLWEIWDRWPVALHWESLSVSWAVSYLVATILCLTRKAMLWKDMLFNLRLIAVRLE